MEFESSGGDSLAFAIAENPLSLDRLRCFSGLLRNVCVAPAGVGAIAKPAQATGYVESSCDAAIFLGAIGEGRAIVERLSSGPNG